MTGSDEADGGLAALRILVVEDEADLRNGIARLLGRLGGRVRTAVDGVEALDLYLAEPADVVVTDLQMPRMTGSELLPRLRSFRNPPEVVILTGYGTIQTAVACLQAGAAHFLTKPFDNDEILRIMERLGRAALRRRGKTTPDAEDDAAPPAATAADESGLIACDPAMLRAVDLVDRAAPLPVAVLIEGESGTGKELLARRVHARSQVASRPVLAVNAAALPDTLLESELFGHKRGAFTGADRDRAGLFVEAKGGTVFLDEIASMSPSFQGKLLRVLQERVVRPLGATTDVPVEFRLVAATNRDLAAMVQAGTFRDDLYYRLGVVIVTAPPLRDRPLDIEPLARRFLAEAAKVCLKPGVVPPDFSPGALDALRSHRWPGNVRELGNAVHRAMVVVTGGRIEPHHLGIGTVGGRIARPGGSETAPGPQSADAEDDYGAAKAHAVEQFQREFVQRALERSGGNVSQAAERCGMTRAALQRIMRQLGVERAEYLDG